ncbi:MAG: hydrogenase nickel incorporation protein HypB [Desulfovibrionaceae bacterium]|nr:hydrogenase nickel incorporation protein HypB [Desulfovibrionaceae bacterium]
MEIPVIRSVFESNEKLAKEVRAKMQSSKILTLNLISSPGAGKTTLLERTLQALAPEFKIAVIEGDLQTDNDARRIAAKGVQVVQINTEGGCHLESKMILEALDQLDLANLDILFIENVGNLVCPVEFDLGEDYKVALLSVTEGDDKPEKYPLLFKLAKVMLLNKVDLLPYVEFDVNKALKFAKMHNPNLEVFEVSCTKDQGLEPWLAWLRAERNKIKA